MITLAEVAVPKKEENLAPILLTDETMEQRKQSVLEKMHTEQLEALVIYADLEHAGNFEYLAGFVPRFEEALLILHADGQAFMALGNENLNKAGKARLAVTPIHVLHFSLPNQPMDVKKSVADILLAAQLQDYQKIGVVGWKNFTSVVEENNHLYDIPYFIMEALKKNSPQASFINAAGIFIGENGARTINNANEFAHYEFGAALSGNCIIEATEALAVGKTEMEIASKLASGGQPHNVVTIMASGERFIKANIYPTNNRVKLGDPISMTTSYKGGLQSRGGYAVAKTEELAPELAGYLEQVAIPYFNAVKVWLQSAKIGMTGAELYQKIEEVFPKEKYGWSLNPGHLCADEEWLSSPIYPESTEQLQSGMLFQIDIIPSVKGYGGISCESGVLLADAKLRTDIQAQYPELWERIQTRRTYIEEVIGIQLPEEILPTSIATAYCQPYLLNKKAALVVK